MQQRLLRLAQSVRLCVRNLPGDDLCMSFLVYSISYSYVHICTCLHIQDDCDSRYLLWRRGLYGTSAREVGEVSRSLGDTHMCTHAYTEIAKRVIIIV